MKKINKILLLVLGLIVLIVVVNLLRDNFTIKESQNNIIQTKTANPQVNEGGNVTVTVKPKILKVGEKPTFEIEFNTHSVELNFEIEKQSYLLSDKNNRSTGSVWNGSPPGGHHRSGTLTFNQPLIKTKFVELVLTDIAGIKERRFRLEL